MSSEATMNPTGGADSRHVMERHSLNPVTVAQVLERDNLQKAWKQVKANKGAPGIDNITIEEFPEYAFRALGRNQDRSSGRDVSTLIR